MKKFILLLAIVASFSFLSAQKLVSQNQGVTSELSAAPFDESSASRAEAILKYINANPSSVVGNSYDGTRYISGCIDFTASQMTNYVGGNIYKISIAVPSTTYMMGLTSYKIWIKNSLNGTIAYEQTVTPVINASGHWEDYTLTTPYTITAGPLVVGFTASFTNATAQNLRPLYASPVADPYQQGGFNYILSTSATAHGSGATWSQFTSTGNLAIEAYVSGIQDLPANDLAASKIASPALKWVDNATTYAVTVFNAGTASQDSYTVEVIDADNNVLGSTPVTTALASGATAIINVPYTLVAANVGNFTVRGKVVLAGDENAANNISDPLTQYVCPMQPMAYCNYGAVTGVAWGADLPHQAAITASDMSPFAGKKLTAIRVAFNVPASTISEGAKVWIRSWLENENLYEQTFTPVDGWNTVVLNTPYPLTTSQIYIGWSAQSSQNYIIGCTQNTPVIEDGGYIQGSTHAWSNYNEQSNMNYNNTIIGVVSDATTENCKPVTNVNGVHKPEDKVVNVTWSAPNGMTPTGYEIYKGVDKLGDSPTTSYTHDISELEPGEYTYNYCVLPVYAAGVCEGTAAKDCKDVSFEVLDIKGYTTTFSIAPNPANDYIIITAKGDFNNIEVLSFLGQVVLSQTNVGNSAKLDIANLTNGVYFVRIISNNGTSVKKFVKQ